MTSARRRQFRARVHVALYVPGVSVWAYDAFLLAHVLHP
jgi:hypothetical protein